MERLTTLVAAAWLAASGRFGNRRARRRLARIVAAVLGGFWWALATPAPAHAFPVSAVVTFFAYAFDVVLSATAATIATFVINAAISIGINVAAQKFLGPKSNLSGQERQASVLSLTIGEGPREAIFGRACTGGTLLDAFNFGGNDRTDWEVLVIKVADHKCDALEGFFINETFYAYSADGVQPGFNGQLEVYWKNGDPAQTASSYLTTNSPNRLYGTNIWTASAVMASMAVFIVAYKADDPKASNPVWPQGRPSFKPVVRGKRCYDPRKDSTVAGGSGTHRWTSPSTWEWTENAEVCRYNYDRGIYAKDQVGDPTQLLIGRGLNDQEAPPDRIFAAANTCDELVGLKAGGTEKRYRVGGVVFANEPFIQVEQKFADAMAGDLVKRSGSVEVLPGVAQSTVAEITDNDLVVGEAVSYQPFLSDQDRINTVIAQYVEPSQLYNSVTAPIRTSSADVTADGGQKNDTPSLDLVTSQTQAQRVAEVRRRLARMEKRLAIVLPPTFSHLEDGDWVGVTSARYFGGERIVMRVDGYAVQQNYRSHLVLREIGTTAYDWTAATDEGTPGQAPVDEFGSLTALALSLPTLSAFSLAGTDGSVQPGFKAGWATPVQKGIAAVRAEVRKVGSTDVATFRCDDPNSGSFTGGPLIAASNMEGRFIPVSFDPARTVTPTAWLPITTVAISLPDLVALIGDGELTPGEKVTFVPTVNALVNARTNLRAAADAAGLTVASANVDRANYETACTNLDSYLAGLTSPVAWNNLTGNTTLSSPSTLLTRIQDAHTYETALQAAIDSAQQTVINTAVQDGTLTPAEKLQVVPIINALISARTNLRAQADAVGLTVASSNALRSAYETACANLDSYLATLTTPVAWNTTSGNTTISSPSTFRTRLQDQQTTETNLQTAIDQAAQGLANMPGANLVFDGGFSLRAQRWTLGSGWIWAQDVVVGPCLFTSTNGTAICSSAEFAVGGNSPYILSAKTLAANITGGSVVIDVEWRNSSHGVISTSTTLAAVSDGNIHYLSVALTAPSTAAFAIVRVRTNGVTFTSGAFWCSGVKLAFGTTTTPFSDETTSQYLQNQYTDPLSGLIGDWHAFPVNLPSTASYRTSVTLSATDTQITVGGYTESRFGSNITVPSGTISGLTSATAYAVYYDLVVNACVAVDVASAASNQISLSRYLFLGFVTTANAGGGTYPAPPPAPPGYVGGGSLHKVYE